VIHPSRTQHTTLCCTALFKCASFLLFSKYERIDSWIIKAGACSVNPDWTPELIITWNLLLIIYRGFHLLGESRWKEERTSLRLVGLIYPQSRAVSIWRDTSYREDGVGASPCMSARRSDPYTRFIYREDACWISFYFMINLTSIYSEYHPDSEHLLA